MLLKVDAAVTVPVNVMPLIDDTDFKTIETDVNYNATGLELIWNFVTSAGAQSHTAVTPTDTGGNYDWTEIGHGMFSIEIPASGGASINNDTEGYGWFTGVATGVLPWRGPIITFAPAHVVDGLVTGSDKLQVDLAEWLGTAAATPTVAGVPEVDVVLVNGAATAGDWTAAEKAQIRHKLDIDGTQTAPSVEGSTVKLADTTDTDKISTLSYRLSYSKLLNVHTVRTGEFTASWDGDDFTGNFQIKVWFAQLNSDGSDILVEGEGDYGTLIGTLAPGSYPGQPTWTENGSFPGGDGLTDGILYVEGLSTGSLSEGWLTLSLSSDSQFGPWEMRFKYSGYTDGDTNFLVGVNGEQYHRQSVQLVAALASTKPILSVQSMAYQNVATITRNGDNTLDETTHADGSVSKINYTAGYATSVTES